MHFEEVRRMLTLYARAHCGEDVRIFHATDKHIQMASIFICPRVCISDMNTISWDIEF